MLDIKYIRAEPERVKTAVRHKNMDVDIDRILELDKTRRDIIGQVETLKAERNTASAAIAKAKKAGEDAQAAIEETRAIGDKIAAYDNDLRATEDDLNDLLRWIPNIPHDGVPVGDESANRHIRSVGEPRKFDFKPLPHWEIGEKLGILDLAAGANVSGTGFFVLKGMGARLQRALISWMIDRHVAESGYTELRVPYLVGTGAMTGTGQLPKMADDMYRVEGDKESDRLWLIPTAEVPVTSLSAGQIIPADELPLKYATYSPCFRRESGAHGKDTRGMIRVHQFDKVELVKIVEPETSYDELESLLADAEAIMQALELPYRVLELATGDMSFASAKTYDIEVHAPGVGAFLEVSSCSNFEDFQARRMNLRARGKGGKPFFPHTLNGSGLALPRTMIAVMENYQTERGTIVVPEVLRGYVGGVGAIG